MVPSKINCNSFDKRTCYGSLPDSLNKEDFSNGSNLDLNSITILIQPTADNFLPFWHKSKHFFILLRI